MIGSYTEISNNLDIYTDIPEISYGKVYLKNYSAAIHSNEKLEINSRADELSFGNNYALSNIQINSDAINNQINTLIFWDNYEERTYQGEINIETNFLPPQNKKPSLTIDILPSNFLLADTVWTISPSQIKIDSTRIEIDDLSISNKQQSIHASGVISHNNADKLDISIQNISLENIDLLTTKNINISGQAGGFVDIYDLYGQPYFLSDIDINNTTYKEQLIGDISLITQWDAPSEALQSELIINNDSLQTIYGYGIYSPGKDSLNFNLNTDHLPLSLLQTVLNEDSFQGIHGLGTGNVKFSGSSQKILMDGDIYGEDAGLTMTYLQVPYTFNDTVKFRSDSIIFDNITIYDPDGNSGIFDGSIRHDNFTNMDYDMSLSSPRILAINTTARNNPKFFGKAYTNATVQITGHSRDITIEGSGNIHERYGFKHLS